MAYVTRILVCCCIKKVSINYVAERAGHSSIETTYKHYSHILDEMRKEDEINTINIFKNMQKKCVKNV